MTTSRGCGIMAMPTEQAMLVHHLPYVHGSSGWLPYSWGWRHNLSKKTDLKRSVFFVFCKLPRLQGKLTNLLPRRPSGEEPCPGRARPRRGGTPPYERPAQTQRRLHELTGCRLGAYQAVERSDKAQRQGSLAGRAEAATATPPRAAPTIHHGGALHEQARPRHRRRNRPLARRGRQGARGATEGSRPRKGPPRPRYNKNGSSALCREATFF